MLYEKELDAVLQEIIRRWGIPGMAVGIVEGSDTVYTRTFGVQSLETGAPVTADSIFCTASISKCFVATAVLRLVEQGKIDLDAPLIRYLPYFRMEDERFPQITIRQMLSHTSGLPDIDETDYDDLVSHPEWDEGAPERFVRSLSGKTMKSNPGERASYSNLAYDVLGDVIAKVTGKTFEAAMQEQVLTPAGMTNSTFLLADVPVNLLAVPHLRTPEMKVNPVYPYHRADAPASFLHATVTDMCRWCTASLNRGICAGRRFLSSDRYDQMWTPVADWGYPRPSMYEQIGLGWTLGHFKEVRTVSHGGMGFGWSAFLLLLPEKNRAAVVLCNEESSARHRVVRALADTLLDQKPQPGKVSWMVPVCRALEEGGIQAAGARIEAIQKQEMETYDIDEDDLISLALQLVSVNKLDLAVGVLDLNIRIFPEYHESHTEKARICQIMGDT